MLCRTAPTTLLNAEIVAQISFATEKTESNTSSCYGSSRHPSRIDLGLHFDDQPYSHHCCTPIGKRAFRNFSRYPFRLWSLVQSEVWVVRTSWQGRYYSCVLGSAHLWAAARYVERNPVRAGMVERAENYPWSSARAHVNGQLDPLLDPGLPIIESIGNWAEWLAAEDLPDQLEAIRTATTRDFPLGEDSFVLELEARLGRPLRPQKRGPKVETREADKQGELTFLE